MVMLENEVCMSGIDVQKSCFRRSQSNQDMMGVIRRSGLFRADVLGVDGGVEARPLLWFRCWRRRSFLGIFEKQRP